MSSLVTFDNFDSIAESCFLVLPAESSSKPASGRKRKPQKEDTVAIKRRTANESKPFEHDGFQLLMNGLETAEAMELRESGFNTLWNQTETMMDDILLGLNRSVRTSIRQFIDSADSLDEKSLIAMPYHEIPTALVSAGINVPDHNAQFNEIANALRSPSATSVGHYVALLESQTCSSLSTMMASMMEQLMAHDSRDNSDAPAGEDMQDSEDNNDEALHVTSYIFTKPSKILNYDLQLLLGWYRHLNHSHRPKLVIILQDFESFDPHVLEDFITIMSQYRTDLPIQFVIGVATSIDMLHQSLTKSAISLLRIEKFRLQKSAVWFEKVLDELFLDSGFTLKFGARPFKFLLDHFYMSDFSVRKVKSSVKYALMHHYYANPLSIFLQLFGLDDVILDMLKSWYDEGITNGHLASHIRMLRSYRKHVEQLVSEEQWATALTLLDDDAYLMTVQLQKWIQDLQLHQRHYKVGMRLIQFVHQQFPAFSGLMKKSRHQIHLEMLENPRWLDSDQTVVLLINLIRKMELTSLPGFLDNLEIFLTDTLQQQDHDDMISGWLQQVGEWQQQLMASDPSLSKSKAKRVALLQNMLVSDATRHTKTSEKVHEHAIDHLKQKGSLGYRMVMDLADWFQQALSHTLISYTALPMHELIYYAHMKLHERSFTPRPGASVHTALTQSSYYLNCSCCVQGNDLALRPTEQDTNLIYESYLECSRMINLFDLYTSFSEKVAKEARPKNQPLEKNEVQARFIRSVAELQFLGFIKPTQRKTDHVLRLTWSTQ
ncbi:hypothetical protein DM01DRAFT_1334342 [Hesseltinella vesiculosa]|uniref:Origin recognition complex subunit 3 n=1 Tax=Hesseltinella vesiculosa TaxID=101127 RepID=A0A1X2GMZ4_9FUNG|nr:hypothetical protein DM01DRAFT_1334342 [Hesseltinella vesiculosa]